MIMEIVKIAVNLVSSAGTSIIISNVIKATTPLTISTRTKVLIWIGDAVVTGFVGNEAGKYAEETIDGISKTINKIRRKFSKKKTEKRVFKFKKSGRNA